MQAVYRHRMEQTSVASHSMAVSSSMNPLTFRTRCRISASSRKSRTAPAQSEKMPLTFSIPHRKNTPRESAMTRMLHSSHTMLEMSLDRMSCAGVTGRVCIR